MLTAEQLSAAMRRSFNLGQTYWQQADSEYTSQHRKADETAAKFEALVAETVAALGVAPSPAPKRYDLKHTNLGGDMREAADGEYVRWDSVEHLFASSVEGMPRG